MSITALATPEQVVVFYKPGAPDTMAPAQILEKMSDAKLIPHGKLPSLEELAAQGGYQKAFSFDSYTPAEAMATFQDHLRTIDPQAEIVVFVKKGDKAYDNLVCTQPVPVDFGQGSYLVPVMERSGMEISEGAKHLDSGLSQKPSQEGRALREVYSTKACNSGTLFEIIEANGEQLQMLLTQGHNFLEKLDSVVSYIAKEASVRTFSENGLKIGFQISVVSTTGVGPAILNTHGVDIAVILAGLNIDGHHRYSIWGSDNYSAAKVVDFLKAHFPEATGGGNDRAAGVQGLMTAEQVFKVLREASLSQLQR